MHDYYSIQNLDHHIISYLLDDKLLKPESDKYRKILIKNHYYDYQEIVPVLDN